MSVKIVKSKSIYSPVTERVIFVLMILNYRQVTYLYRKISILCAFSGYSEG